MNKKQYQLIDWQQIEGITYADQAHPFSVLGLQTIKKEKLIQAFFPDAQKVSVVLDDKTKMEMELVDEEGFYLLFLNKTQVTSYTFELTKEKGKKVVLEDPYAFHPVLDKKAYKDFGTASNKELYRLFGTKKHTMDGKEGYLFTVFAPNAYRVSLVGDFNAWDGRVNPMEKDEEMGVFYLFMPGMKEGTKYRYEIASKGSEVMVKNDPFAYAMKEGCSVVSEVPEKELKPLRTDKVPYMEKEALNILEVDLFAAPEGKNRLKSFGREVINNAKKLHYTHIQLLPVSCRCHHRKDYYYLSGLFGMDEALGSKEELALFVEECHKENLGIILDLNLAFFPNTEGGMDNFDGTHMYEHADIRQGYHRSKDAFLYQYGNVYVQNYLKSVVDYWVKFFGLDGVHFSNLSGMLYLDYEKKDGEWVPNPYGGKENLEAISFIKELNKYMKKAYPHTLKIAEMDCVWEHVTNMYSKDGLGYDYMWNTGFADSLDDYLKLDPAQRTDFYYMLTSPSDYMFLERFILPLSHREENRKEKTWLLNELPGTIQNQYDNARVALAYGAFYPGKKLTFLRVAEDKNPHMERYMEALNGFYAENRLLFESEYKEETFEWVNSYSSDKNTIVFLRKGAGKNPDFLTVILNFSNYELKDFTLGALKPGKYKVVFHSDAEAFGGTGKDTNKWIATDETEYDGMEQSLTLNVPAMSAVVLAHKPFTAKELEQIALRKRKALEKYVAEEIEKLNTERENGLAEIRNMRDKQVEEIKKNADARIREAKKNAKQQEENLNLEMEKKIASLKKML